MGSISFKGALFDEAPARTDDDKKIRKECALQNFQDFLRPLLVGVVGQELFEDRTKMVFEALQYPILNKQVHE